MSILDKLGKTFHDVGKDVTSFFEGNDIKDSNAKEIKDTSGSKLIQDGISLVSNIMLPGPLARVTDMVVSKTLNNTQSPNDPPPLQSIPMESIGDLKTHFHKLFLEDLTETLLEKGKSGELDLNQSMCMGREEELKLLTLYLMLSTNNSAILVLGPTGSGKTTLMRELARKILQQEVPEDLRGCHIFLVTSETTVMTIAALHKTLGRKAIFFLDEAHNKISEELKALVSAGARIILATDRLASYSSLKHDPAWKNRRVKIHLLPLSPDTCFTILSTGPLQDTLSKRLQRKVTLDESAIRFALQIAHELEPKRPNPKGASFILECAVVAYSLDLDYESDIDDENGKQPITFTKKDIKKYILHHYQISTKQLTEMIYKIECLSKSQIPLEEPLSKHTTNLTFHPKGELFQPAWGRDSILDTIALSLTSSQSNNVLLIGPAGCGKTRIAEGLVQKIREGTFPLLEGYEVLKFDPGVLQTFEFSYFIDSAERMIQEGKKFIIIIDEFHRLDQIKDRDSEASILEEFKEALAKGLRILGMTTSEEAGFLKKEALQRRFVIKHIPLLTFEETLTILQKEAPLIAARYKKENEDNIPLSCEDEVLSNVIHLSFIYSTTRVQPAAAVQLFDTVYSYYNTLDPSTRFTTDVAIQAIVLVKLVSEEEVRKNLQDLQISASPSERSVAKSHSIYTFCTSWTGLVLRGEIDFTPGREMYLQQIVAILEHNTCNNVLLLGETGIGKTTLIKNFAHRLVHHPEDFPQALRNKPLLAVTMADITDPTQFAAFLFALSSLKGKCILFVDEVHALFQKDPLTALFSYIDPLKPFLAEGLTLIGATTPYDLNFNDLDPSIQSRFSCITLPTPTPEELYQMVQPTARLLTSQAKKEHNLTLTVPEELIRWIIRYPRLTQTPRNVIWILEHSVKQAIKNRPPALEDNPEALKLEQQHIVIPPTSFQSSRWLPRIPSLRLPLLTRLFFTSLLHTVSLRTIVKVTAMLLAVGFLGRAVLRHIPTVSIRR